MRRFLAPKGIVVVLGIIGLFAAAFAFVVRMEAMVIGTLFAVVIAVSLMICMKLQSDKKEAEKQRDQLKENLDFSTNFILKEIIAYLDDPDDKRLEVFFRENDMKCVALYGTGAMSEFLYKELTRLGIEVDFVIGKKDAKFAYEEVSVYQVGKYPLDSQIDAIIISEFETYQNISLKLLKSLDNFDGVQIVSIQEVL